MEHQQRMLDVQLVQVQAEPAALVLRWVKLVGCGVPVAIREQVLGLELAQILDLNP
jgi:hypothetical protein